MHPEAALGGGGVTDREQTYCKASTQPLQALLRVGLSSGPVLLRVNLSSGHTNSE